MRRSLLLLELAMSPVIPVKRAPKVVVHAFVGRFDVSKLVVAVR